MPSQSNVTESKDLGMIAKSYGYVYVAHERNYQWPFRYGRQPGPVLLPKAANTGKNKENVNEQPLVATERKKKAVGTIKMPTERRKGGFAGKKYLSQRGAKEVFYSTVLI